MTDTVTPNEPADQPDHFAEIAAELHRIADDLAKLAGSGLPKPWITFAILPGEGLNDEEVAARVDAVSVALFGRPGVTETDTRGIRRRRADGRRGLVRVDIHEPLSADTGMSYTRADTEVDDPTPVSPARVPLHTGGVVDGGQLVDETAPLADPWYVPAPGLVVGDTATEQRDAANAAYERDETGPTCQFESGGRDGLRQRCGESIRWDERYAKWLHVDAVWRGHDAVAPVGPSST